MCNGKKGERNQFLKDNPSFYFIVLEIVRGESIAREIYQQRI
jgi:hypothetical protein